MSDPAKMLEGYWAAEQDKFKRLTVNPHRKP